MSKNRIKLKLPAIGSRAEAETAMTQLTAAVNAQRCLLAARDRAVLLINEQYEGVLSEAAELIKARTLSLQAWAEANRVEFPKDRKSLALTSGALGFRTGTPKLEPVSRHWTWAKVLAAIKASVKWKMIFLRTREDVDKEAILSLYSALKDDDKARLAEELRAVGVQVVQNETFFVEPDLANLDARQTTEVA